MNIDIQAWRSVIGMFYGNIQTLRAINSKHRRFDTFQIDVCRLNPGRQLTARRRQPSSLRSHFISLTTVAHRFLSFFSLYKLKEIIIAMSSRYNTIILLNAVFVMYMSLPLKCL